MILGFEEKRLGINHREQYLTIAATSVAL